MAGPIKATTVEFHRMGPDRGQLVQDTAYIRTHGFQKAAQQITLQDDPLDIASSNYLLRYGPDSTTETVESSKALLCKVAAGFLDPAVDALAGPGPLRQLDIVTHAAELRAFPFEALYADPRLGGLASVDTGVVLTRRIRGDFSEEVPPWPEKPSVLFVHAQLSHDLRPELVDQHRAALAEALRPWAEPDQLQAQGLLTVCQVRSLDELRQAREGGSYSHIHVLAHGMKIQQRGRPAHLQEWGLRLGTDAGSGATPNAVAQALAPREGHPLVVTLAACDGSTNEATSVGNASVAEELHRSGIPVVIASQLPLTQPGSVTLAKAFYGPLLSGQDVRRALHAARVALRQQARKLDERIHDWLGVVGYVRLPPEGYSAYLQGYGLRVQLRLLEAARKQAEPLFGPQPPGRELCGQVNQRLNDCLVELERLLEPLSEAQHRALRGECAGLMASAGKSLAELRFLQSRHWPEDRDTLAAESRDALTKSLDRYRESFRRDTSRHWQGIQQLSIELALTGRLGDPTDLPFVRKVAETARLLDDGDYWACGTLAEAILLEGALTGRPDVAAAREMLAMLLARSATNPEDQGYAALSTRRQLARYVTWWTQAQGYFPGLPADLSQPAAELVDFLKRGC